MKTIAAVSLAIVVCLLPAGAGADVTDARTQTGWVHVLVKDENGVIAANAPVYIRDQRKTLTIHAADSEGSLNLSLQPGDYVLSSAITHPIADSIDRYVSPEVVIHVEAQENTSLILSLHLTEDAISNLSLSTLQKIGVAKEVSKYFN